MDNLLKQELIKNAVAKLDEPWKNLTTKVHSFYVENNF